MVLRKLKRKFLEHFITHIHFFLYANIDGFDYKENEIDFSKKPELDRWIISKLNSLIIEVDNYYKDFEPTKAARAISNLLSII